MNRSILVSKKFGVVAVALIMSMGFVACNDDEDVVPVEDQSKVGVLNLMTDETVLDVHLGEKKINSTGITGQTFTYFTVDAQQDRLSIFEAGETDTLVSAHHHFKAGENFSAIVFGNADDAELLIASDDLEDPTGGKSKIRFANLLDADHPLELWMADAEEALQDEAAYATVKTFIEVEPVTDVTLQVRGVDSEEILADLEEVKFESGKIYTVLVLNSVLEGVETPVIRVITNN
ncbi:MAG TPA: DUF4397 domain-containing protein [Sphingobacteriaceae bacterium]|nr:DUF4397 domain-containing protein [Sphingobacteriaceae bacterium]